MAFTEVVLKIRDSITEEQSTELREFLVEACQQLQADPELMAMGLQRLKEELTDQGYEWENLVGTMLQLVEPSLTIESVKKLKAAWNDSMASNASIADFTAILNSDFPIINEVFRNLANEALEEHSALSGLAGGTHIGQGIVTAGSKTGKALASPWNKNSKLNKKERIIGEAVEVGIASVGLYLGGKAIGKKIYNAGDNRQLWGTINQKIGGRTTLEEEAPTFRQWTSESLFHPLDHPTVPGFPRQIEHRVDDPQQTLRELTAARNRLIEAGTLTKEQENQLFENAYSALSNRNFAYTNMRADVVRALHPDPEIRQFADYLNGLQERFKLPSSFRSKLDSVDSALARKGIDINGLDNIKLSAIFGKEVRGGGELEELEPTNTEIAILQYSNERTGLAMNWDPPGVESDLKSMQAFRGMTSELNRTDSKLIILNYAERKGITIDGAIEKLINNSKDVFIEPDELSRNNQLASNARNGLDINGNPLSDSEIKLNKAANLILGRTTFLPHDDARAFQDARTEAFNNYNKRLQMGDEYGKPPTNPEQGPSRNWAEELVEKGEVQGIGEKLGGVNPRRARRVIIEDASEVGSGAESDRGSVSGFANDLAGDNPEISVQQFSGLASESSYREFSGVLSDNSYREFSGIEDFAKDDVDAAVNQGKNAASNLVDHEVDAAGNLVDNAESDL